MSVPRNAGEGPGTDDVPAMMTECPVCIEQLFDEDGVACNGDVAKIMCCHLVHDTCLREAARSLNSDGKRFGIGGPNLQPRAGCPVCNCPVSFWSAYQDAAAFPIFWLKRILGILAEIGPNGGPVPVEDVMIRLLIDETLTSKQKTQLRGTLRDALQEGAMTWVVEEVDGGIHNGGGEKMYYKKGAWYWNKMEGTLWLYKWGEVPSLEMIPPPYIVRKAHKKQRPRAPKKSTKAEEASTSGGWGLCQWLILILILIIAIVASIYFDNGEEITW